MWKMYSTFLNAKWCVNEITSENGKYLEMNANEHITYQHL